MTYQMRLMGSEAQVSNDMIKNAITIIIPKAVFCELFPDKVEDVILVCEKDERREDG